ncbi:MAG TPA: S8 family serine peptidase, partial [Myxococcota bacterium]|nr:S8 family serine peptidase [Myxococcota bacterium]
MYPLRSPRPAGLALLLLSGCASSPDSDSAALESAAPSPELDPALAAPLALGRPVVAVLRLDDQPIAAEIARLRTAADRPGDRPALLATRAAAWKRQADALLQELPPGVTVERVYTHIPVVALRLERTEAALALLQRPDVLSLEANVAHTTDLTQSLALIGQPTAHAAGFLGAGTSVAVLDTGADWTVSDLGSCTAVGTPATCRVVYAADIAANDGQRDDSGSPHGTNVSSIVAQVAPGTDILALDVFSGGAASSTDIIAAIDWVIANQATYNIAALNMSLGSGAYTAPCSTAFSSAIANARAAGVVVVAATGNNAYTNAMASPACDTNALSVGAVYDGSYGAVAFGACFEGSTASDKVACFSNTASFLDILAPGAFITAGGVTMSGTSQAAPHVAGAAAVLRATDASATVDQLEDRLTSNGVTVTDSRTGMSFPRLALDASVTDCISSLSPSSFSADAAGDSDSISLSADSSCAWTVSSDASWLTTGSSSGTG